MSNFYSGMLDDADREKKSEFDRLWSQNEPFDQMVRDELQQFAESLGVEEDGERVHYHIHSDIPFGEWYLSLSNRQDDQERYDCYTIIVRYRPGAQVFVITSVFSDRKMDPTDSPQDLEHRFSSGTGQAELAHKLRTCGKQDAFYIKQVLQ